MKWLIPIRLLRILFAITIIASTVFFDRICSRPRPTNECANSASMLQAHHLKGIAENATVGLDKYELDERLCTTVSLIRVFNNVIHLKSSSLSELFVWNLFFTGADLLTALLIYFAFYYNKSLWVLISAFVLESMAYIAWAVMIVLGYLNLKEKRYLISESQEFVPVQYKVILILVFIGFVVFAYDIYFTIFYDNSFKIKLNVQWKHKIPMAEEHQEKSFVVEHRVTEKPGPRPIMIKAFKSDVFDGHDGFHC